MSRAADNSVAVVKREIFREFAKYSLTMYQTWYIMSVTKRTEEKKMKRNTELDICTMINRAVFMAQSGYTMEQITEFVNTLIHLDMIDKVTGREMIDMASRY